MAVKRCPSCGDLYLAAVDRCADCDVALVEVAEEGSTGDGADTGAVDVELGEDGDSWDLSTWTMEGRRLLDGMLGTIGIPRAWQGSTLVTPRSMHEKIEEMVAVVASGDARVGLDDARLAAADATVVAELGPTVAYEVSDWDPEALRRVTEALLTEGIPFGWDDDADLVVPEAHEGTVDAIFAALDRDEDDEEDGPEAHEAISELFLAADTLSRNPLDGPARRAALASAERLEGLRLPFGFSPAVWESIRERAGALATEIESGGVDDDSVEETAIGLRAVLRDYV